MKRNHFGVGEYVIMALLVFLTFVVCVAVGSVNLKPGEILSAIGYGITHGKPPATTTGSIILTVRIPRILCVALTGASLAISGAAMQGLLKNPLADGSTIGVSSGASLGAVLTIAFDLTIPGFRTGSVTVMSILFAFLSLVLILSLAYRLDCSLSTSTIILIGVIFSMFVSSIISFIVTFAGEKVKTITFWTMGSLAGSKYQDVWLMLGGLILFGGMLLSNSRELNAFAVGEDNARNIGVDVKKVKLLVLVSVSALIGISVSIGGTIGFVGLVIPHITRMLVGPNHGKLLPASLFCGSIFLMLADLLSRTVLKPLELPIGVVTSFIGSLFFIYIFYKSRKG